MRSSLLALALAALALAALFPVSRLALDRFEFASMPVPLADLSTTRGYDWVVWNDTDGLITAQYVFPDGPAFEAGLREGDELYEFGFTTYFTLEDFVKVAESVPPGEVRTYTIKRDSGLETYDVVFGEYPTLLYPLSNALWRASFWGFFVAVFIHVLALVVVIPLARRSKPAQRSAWLIVASTVWVGGQVARLVLIAVVGPPDLAGAGLALLFRVLTLTSLIGWIAFPAGLVHKVIADSGVRIPSAARALAWVPALVLVAVSLLSILAPSVLAPVTMQSLIRPILFYVCLYIAGASGLYLVLERSSEVSPSPSPWSRAGSTGIMLFATVGAFSVFGTVPVEGTVTDTTVGWIVVAGQLLTVLPVLLVSYATLKYGKIDAVLRQWLTYVLVLGAVTVLFLAGMTLLSPEAAPEGLPLSITLGLLFVVLAVVFERLVRQATALVSTFFGTDRQRMLRFVERMRSYLDAEELVEQTVEVVGQSLDVRSARLFVESDGRWIDAAFQPEEPVLTEADVRELWPTIEEAGAIWSTNPELDESGLSYTEAVPLDQAGVALAVPIQSDGKPSGLLVLGPKRNRRDVYNLDEVDTLRTISSGLAFALDRLAYLEREKALIRASAESKLAALRAQINPHFLFNALNTISAFAEDQPSEAVRAVEHLSAIFRHILHTDREPFVTLQSELKLVEHYLAIEQMRMGERLQVERHIAPEALSYSVPAFALQTLVENAVKHGLSPKGKGGTVTLHAGVESAHLTVGVEDDGIGIAHSGEPAAVGAFYGIGLSNVAGRLQHLYGRDDLLTFDSAPGEGTHVTMKIPTT